MGFERDNFDPATENIAEAENSILFDELNSISTNKSAVIPAPCGDKGDEDLQMLFLAYQFAITPWQSTVVPWLMKQFRGKKKKKDLNGRILLGLEMTLLTIVLGEK